MSSPTNRLRIANELLVACDIREDQFRAFALHQSGFTGREIGYFLRRGKSTINRWLITVEDKIDQAEAGEEAGGDALAGVTIDRASLDTDTPFIKDPCLTALGF